MVAFKDWRVSHKYIRINHNKVVVDFFKGKTLAGEINLKNSLLVYKKDTASQMQVKMQCFEQYVRMYEPIIPVQPEWWQVRKGANVPQLVITWKAKIPTKENISSRWSSSLPHFIDDPKKVNSIKGYKKGNIQGMITLKDNSKIIIYANTNSIAERTLRKLVKDKLFDEEYLAPKDYKIKLANIGGEFQALDIVPTYAKYFKTGQKKLTPDWVVSIT